MRRTGELTARGAGGGAVDFGQRTDNAAKYERVGGVEGRLLARFRRRLLTEVAALAPARVLDAGCGEGHVTAWIARALPAAAVTGLEGRADALAAFRERNPGLRAVEGDLRALPFDDDAFDLVVSTEVLEHLDDPRAAVRELARVSAGHVLLTVPHEPFFRAGNLARGRYLARLGSTPGHRWTWGRRSFLRVVGAEVDPVRWLPLFPWQGVVGRPLPGAGDGRRR
jgi:SAM-dependent methyltransferase